MVDITNVTKKKKKSPENVLLKFYCSSTNCHWNGSLKPDSSKQQIFIYISDPPSSKFHLFETENESICSKLFGSHNW